MKSVVRNQLRENCTPKEILHFFKVYQVSLSMKRENQSIWNQHLDFIPAGPLPEEVSPSSLPLSGTAPADSQKQPHLSLLNGMQGHKHIWQNAVLAGINPLVSPQLAGLSWVCSKSFLLLTNLQETARMDRK